MKDLETMQREGREKVDSYANTWGWHHKVCMGNQHFPSCPVIHLENDLDQHTADTWKAAQEASQKRIEELEEEVEDLVMEIKEAGEYD